MNGIGLYWYRGGDLRIDDQPALNELRAACERGVYGAFVIERRWLARISPGIPRMAAGRLRWLIETLTELQAGWRERGSELFVGVGDSSELIPLWARTLGAGHVTTTPVPCTEEDADNQAVGLALSRANVHLRVVRDSTLLALDDLPFEPSALPPVFTAFRKKVEKAWAVRSCVAAPSHLADDQPPPDALPVRVPTLDALTSSSDLADLCVDDSLVPWMPGEAGGHRRLRAFIWETQAVAHYKDTRNGLLDRDDATRLSPWLSHGSLSARQVYAEVRAWEAAHGANESSYWVIFELLWRDFFHFWSLQHGADVFARSGVKHRRLQWHAHRRYFDAWCRGETGEPFVDAGMRELRMTGYLSNRLRQNVASWLARTSHIDWRWGARWFESQLIDFDPCANWGNWQYLAGVGNDPRDRTFNVRLQAERYDPTGAYQQRWLSRE